MEVRGASDTGSLETKNCDFFHHFFLLESAHAVLLQAVLSRAGQRYLSHRERSESA
jgi:hypothetical protein